MKNQKLLISVAIVCLLVGASGAAMALETCAEGILQGTEEEPLVVEGDIIIDGRSCFINDVIVNGNVTATNSEDLTMIDNQVNGDVRVTGGRDAIVTLNTVKGNLLVRRNERALVVLNVASQIIWVNRTIKKATVKKNAAAIAIVCNENGRLDAFENEAPEVECHALGGGFDGFFGAFGFGNFMDEP
jgi:hypothetical protein